MFNELLSKIKTWIRHNTGLFVCFILCCILAIWFFGCQSKAPSIIHEGLLVTEPELHFEYSAELRRIESELSHLEEITELRLQQISEQDAIKQALFHNAMIIAESGTINPLGILSLLGTLFGIGALIDNRKKDGLIKGLKNRPPE